MKSMGPKYSSEDTGLHEGKKKKRSWSQSQHTLQELLVCAAETRQTDQAQVPAGDPTAHVTKSNRRQRGLLLLG